MSVWRSLLRLFCLSTFFSIFYRLLTFVSSFRFSFHRPTIPSSIVVCILFPECVLSTFLPLYNYVQNYFGVFYSGQSLLITHCINAFYSSKTPYSHLKRPLFSPLLLQSSHLQVQQNSPRVALHKSLISRSMLLQNRFDFISISLFQPVGSVLPK